MLHALYVVRCVRPPHVHLQCSHLHQLVPVVEARRKDIEDGRAGGDELLQVFGMKGRPIDSREENGFDLVETEFVRRLVCFNKNLERDRTLFNNNYGTGFVVLMTPYLACTEGYF